MYGCGCVGVKWMALNNENERVFVSRIKIQYENENSLSYTKLKASRITRKQHFGLTNVD